MQLPPIRRFLARALNPALCLACRVPINSDQFLCRHCRDSLPRVENPCEQCGLPNHASGNLCPACLIKPPRWQRMTAPLMYAASTRRLIHELKFNDQIHIANALTTHFHGHFIGQDVDCLIPVPLHRSRLLDRGFNQSEEIARKLSTLLGIPLNLESLRRQRATQSQSGLSLNKRRQNILKAFSYEPDKKYRSIAVVDDIITTGSTVDEICKTLHQGGVQTVHVWALARALKSV